MKLELLIDWSKPIVTLTGGGTPYKLHKELDEGEFRYGVASKNIANPKALRWVNAYGYDPGGILVVKNEGVSIAEEKKKLRMKRGKTSDLAKRDEDLEAYVFSLNNAVNKLSAKLALARLK